MLYMNLYITYELIHNELINLWTWTYEHNELIHNYVYKVGL